MDIINCYCGFVSGDVMDVLIIFNDAMVPLFVYDFREGSYRRDPKLFLPLMEGIASYIRESFDSDFHAIEFERDGVRKKLITDRVDGLGIAVICNVDEEFQAFMFAREVLRVFQKLYGGCRDYIELGCSDVFLGFEWAFNRLYEDFMSRRFNYREFLHADVSVPLELRLGEGEGYGVIRVELVPLVDDVEIMLIGIDEIIPTQVAEYVGIDNILGRCVGRDIKIEKHILTGPLTILIKIKARNVGEDIIKPTLRYKVNNVLARPKSLGSYMVRVIKD